MKSVGYNFRVKRKFINIYGKEKYERKRVSDDNTIILINDNFVLELMEKWI